MKKVIVTTENYEEVMFNLLEDQYPRDVRENILDQIHADTFLAFEWNQWSKAIYSESTEPYKIQEAAFIENLTREEEKKKGFIYYLWPTAIAASIVLLIGVFILFPSGKTNTNIVSAPVQEEQVTEQMSPSVKDKKLDEKEEMPANINVTGKRGSVEELVNADPKELVPFTDQDTMTVAEVPRPQPIVPSMQDTVRRMIASAQKQPRYKITIIEEKAGDLESEKFKFEEKRYSMADVMNHKDGITLSKFLENSNSRIVTDKNTNKVTIEYIAEDHSILVLTLSN
jgi:hypothetical protein